MNATLYDDLGEFRVRRQDTDDSCATTQEPPTNGKELIIELFVLYLFNAPSTQFRSH